MGNIAFAKGQFGVETTPGTLVAAVRGLVGTLKLEDDKTRELRDEVRGSFAGGNTLVDLAYASKGKYTGDATVAELPLWLSAGLRGDVTPTTPDGSGAPLARLWTFTAPTAAPIPATKFLTLYHGDDTQVMRAGGCFATKIKLMGGPKKRVSIETEVAGRRYQTGTFAGVTSGGHEAIKSQLNKWFIDPTSGTIGATQLAGTMYDWSWTYDSGITADYTEDGTLDMTGVNRKTPTVMLEFTAKWNTAMVTEFTNYDNATRRLIRMENTGTLIAATTFNRLRIDGCYTFTEFTPLDGDQDGTTLVKVKAQAYESPVDGFWFELSAQNRMTSLTTP